MKSFPSLLLLLFAFSTCAFAGDFLQTLPLEDFPSIRDAMEGDNLSLVQRSGADGVVSNVFPVYMAGYIHSKAAIPVLLDRIEWNGANEPRDRYYRAPSSSGGVGSVRLFPVPLFPQPPTPSVGALTQMPVAWDVLQQELESPHASRRRMELLAWVAMVHHPSNYTTWLNQSMSADSNRWEHLAAYTSTNLVGRKPFYMGVYTGCQEFAPETRILYDRCIAELWRRRTAAVADGDFALKAAAEEILASMGQPEQEPSPEEWGDSIELVTENVDVEEILDLPESQQ